MVRKSENPAPSASPTAHAEVATFVGAVTCSEAANGRENYCGGCFLVCESDYEVYQAHLADRRAGGYRHHGHHDWLGARTGTRRRCGNREHY